MAITYERHILVKLGVTGGVSDMGVDFEWYYPAGKKRYLEFNATVDCDSDDNVGTLDVWNLTEAKLRQIYDALKQAGIKIEEGDPDGAFHPYAEVYAGYGPGQPPLIFNGRILKLPEMKWSGADMITSFKLGRDTEDRTARKRCNREWTPGTMWSTVVRDLLNDLEIALGAPPELGVDYPLKEDLQFAPEMAIRSALDQCAQNTDSEFYVLNSLAFFVPRGWGIPTGSALSPETGLIHNAEIAFQAAWTGVEEIHFTCLMNSWISLNSMVPIESANFTGTVKVKSITYNIGNHDFYMVCKGEILDEQTQLATQRQYVQGRLDALRKSNKRQTVFAQGNRISIMSPEEVEAQGIEIPADPVPPEEQE